LSARVQREPRLLRRLIIFLASLSLALGAIVGVSAPVQAATGNILPPFDVGQTWNICQGYNNPNVTHTGTSSYGLDLTGAGCDNSASGRNVRASMSGTVAYYQAAYGNLCINVDDGRSYTLTHINSSITSGTVTAGQLVGTVAAPGQRGNNGVAHIHFQMWSTSNCYSSSGIPFDSAHNARICGAPDLAADGPTGTGNGTWSGTSFVGVSCDGSVSHRIALLNSSSQVYVKDTLSGGGWISQGASASAIDVGGSRVALINSAGQVFAKDSVTGTGGWISQGTTAQKVVVGSGGRMFIINSANQVYGKDNASIAGGWIDQGAEAIDVAVGTNRVAIVTPCGAVYAKSSLSNGGWIKQADCNTAEDVELSSTGLIAIIRTDGAIFAKDNISGLGGWIDQGADAAQLKLGANRLLILTPGSYVYAKDSLGTGGWISQGTTAVEIAISDQGRFVVRNTASQVYAKDAINPGGWVDQEAVALAIAA